MRELQRIRHAIREQNYRISSHANEEMSDDDLLADVEGAMLAIPQNSLLGNSPAALGVRETAARLPSTQEKK